MYELDVINKMDFLIILVVWDLLNIQSKIIFSWSGRGSVVVLQLVILGITDVDPIEYNLLLKIFKSTKSHYADIDTDFDASRRDEY